MRAAIPSRPVRSRPKPEASCVLLRHPFTICAAGDVCYPRRIVEVPAHGLANAAFERLSRRPPQLACRLACIDGVAAIVSGPVLDELYLLGIGATISARPVLVQDATDRMHDLDIPFFAVAAQIVGLAYPSASQNAMNGAAVILDEEPVANLVAVAVDRQGFALQRVVDDQRDQLFRKLIRAIVVGAIGGYYRQPIGFAIRADKMVGGSLAGRVGAVGAVLVLLGEGRFVRSKRAKYFVG